MMPVELRQVSTTERLCSGCNRVQAAAEYPQYKGKPTGRCRECRNTAARGGSPLTQKPWARIVDGKKLCSDCATVKLLSDFSPGHGAGGVYTYCKPCASKRVISAPDYAEKNRQKARSYYLRNRAVYLSNFRLRKWERRHREKVQADGTVTPTFLASLYEESICHYCHNQIPKLDRTADHKTPLCRGGPHSAANLVMACKNCNCSKRVKTESEFFAWRATRNTTSS